MTNDVYLYLKKKMNYPQNKLLSTWKLRKRVMEKQKRQSASMLQRQEGKYLRVVMWGQQEIMKGETEHKPRFKRNTTGLVLQKM